MDLWTKEAQDVLLAVLLLIANFVLPLGARWLRNYLSALEAKALVAAKDAGGQLLYTVAETAVRWVEQTASNEVTKWTSKQKLAKAADYVQSQLPDVSRETAVATIESVVNAIKRGWAPPSIVEAYSACPPPAPGGDAQ